MHDLVFYRVIVQCQTPFFVQYVRFDGCLFQLLQWIIEGYRLSRFVLQVHIDIKITLSCDKCIECLSKHDV